MRRSKVELYLHLVWVVKGRQDRITGAFEAEVYRCITGEAANLGCQVFAIGGLSDHIHLLAQVPGKVSASHLAQQVKGVSSRLMNKLRPEFSDRFDWQPGYGCFSLGRNQIDPIRKYIEDQKQHHQTGKTWPDWEETDEPDTSQAD